MANFKQDILDAVGEEEILAIVVRSPLASWYRPNGEPRDNITPEQLNVSFLNSLQALELLDYEYADGYGVMDCHDVNVYTETRVYYIHEYDGSTCFHSVLRNF